MVVKSAAYLDRQWVVELVGEMASTTAGLKVTAMDERMATKKDEMMVA